MARGISFRGRAPGSFSSARLPSQRKGGSHGGNPRHAKAGPATRQSAIKRYVSLGAAESARIAQSRR